MIFVIGIIVLLSLSIASTLLWIGMMCFYVYTRIGWVQLFAQSINDLATLSAITFVPVIGLWLVVGLIYNTLHMKKQGNTINFLLSQTRKAADHSESMVRALQELQVQTRSSIVLHNAEFFLDELNDLLGDILIRLGMLQPNQVELIWKQIGDGNKWAFCKSVLYVADNSPRFEEDFMRHLINDDILNTYVRSFCYRFEQMFTILEHHDIENYLTKILEEDSVGRVYKYFVDACRKVDAIKNPPPEPAVPVQFREPEEPVQSYYSENAEEENQQTVIEERKEVYYDDPDPVPEYAEEEVSFPSYEEPIQNQSVQQQPAVEEQRPASSPFGFLRATR